MFTLGLDIGSNSVGSCWRDGQSGYLATATSVFPAGVEESDDKRGDPKNVKRRLTRHTRVTLARRAERKRELRLKLILIGLLPHTGTEFKELLDQTDPWKLREKGLDHELKPHQFGRVLLHLAQRRGALGLKTDGDEEGSDGQTEDGKVKEAIKQVAHLMKQRNARTFGEFIARLRVERVTAITSPDQRPIDARKGPREFRGSVRNKAGSYEHCVDRKMIREEFCKLWNKQREFEGPLAEKLTDALRRALDDESSDGIWRHKGLLFGQRKTYWDTGTLGRCDLEPTERCVPHADVHASRFLVVETLNNLKVVEIGKAPRALTPDERERINVYLSGPLGSIEKGRFKGRPKRSVSVADLRDLMEWGPARKTSHFRFNIETDEERTINTDWFSREIIHGAISCEKWKAMPDRVKDGLNRAILKYDPDEEGHAAKLRTLVFKSWTGLTEIDADALVAAWKTRPRPDAKRLNLSRRAVRNLLQLMDRAEPWADPKRPGEVRWLTEIEARKLIAEDAEFLDVTTGKPLNEKARSRYATGAKGATARDRHFMRKHILTRDGAPVYGPDGLPLHEPPPVPLISNPVVRKSIHEVRRHLIEYMKTFFRKPDEVYVELSREAKMGKKQADALLLRNRLRNRIRRDIITAFSDLEACSSTQQRAAVDRVVLALQQRCICPLCGKTMLDCDGEGITLRSAAFGEGCEVAHIIPRASGGHNGLGNVVLAHTKCNRDMQRRTPREFWNATVRDGFAAGIGWTEQIYGSVQRPKPSEIKSATGNSLWSCYFNEREDRAKIEQFKKDIKDTQQMTNRQDAATKYAARQVMAYLADALYDGNGPPERGGKRKIFASDGMWTARFRREWELFFDPHDMKAHGLSNEEEHVRKEKNRGDHRHHAIDAVVIALSTEGMRKAWDAREVRADRDGVNTANEEAMKNYRRQHRLPLPSPFQSREEFQQAVRRAVFGDGAIEKPICHRPVKRKLIGPLHKATQYGPVIDQWMQGGIVHRELVQGRTTIRQDVIGEAPSDFLKPMQLRLPRRETDEEAVIRLTRRLRIGKRGLRVNEAVKCARKLVKTSAFTRAIVDPKPEKGGLVRDAGLRRLLRARLEERGLNPDNYSKGELKKSLDIYGPLTMGPLDKGKNRGTGAPIHRVILLWSINDPVAIPRRKFEHGGRGRNEDNDPAAIRLYDSQNNHHIEIRAKTGKDGAERWRGRIRTSFEVSRQLIARHRLLSLLEKPFRQLRRKLTATEKKGLSAECKSDLQKRRLSEWKQAIQGIKPQRKKIIDTYPVVDRSEDKEDGKFVMSLCEGEMLFMKDKRTNSVGYFVVAKLDKDKGVVVVPHWDARSATPRKDADAKKVADSEREQFTVTPTDLKDLAPPGHPHAMKIRVSPLGKIRVLHGD